MTDSDPRAQALSPPAELPIFPLTGVLLLPGGRLPLNIFEPRYLAMVEDAMASGRIIGMVQPSGGETMPAGSVGDENPVYRVGCAGRIVAFSETDDGRYLVTLLGVARFQIVEELAPRRGYRRVLPDYTPFAGDDNVEAGHDQIDRERLLAKLKDYFEARQLSANWSVINDADDERLVTSLAMICPFNPREKQALLECRGLRDRTDMMIALFEMSLHEDGGEGDPLLN